MIDSGSKTNLAMKRSSDSDETPSETKKKAISHSSSNNLEKKDLGSSIKKKPLPNISIKLGDSTKTSKSSIGKAALVFSQDDDDEEEEMPPEAKMRMKNIGRDTPTSSGPNSFGKSRMGFCDSKKMYERKLKEIQDKLEEK